MMSTGGSFAVPVLLVSLFVVCPPAPAVAGENEVDTTVAVYRLPSQPVVDIIEAPMPPRVQLGPDGETLLLMDWELLTTMEELAADELRLAGHRINPATHGPSRQAPTVGLSLMSVSDGVARAVSGLPSRPKFGNIRWSPDGARVAFTHTASEGIELWVLEVAEAAARRLTPPVLNLTARVAPSWIDNETLLCALIPAGQGKPPSASAIPGGPVIQQNLGKMSPARTYQDLLEDDHDAALFEHYFTSQLVRVDMSGGVVPLGEPALFSGVDPSPDGRFLLVEALHRPFSYLVQANRFPQTTAIWTVGGELVKELHDRPLQESIPIAFGSVATGLRNAEWRSDQPATIVWAEAQDDGDAGKEAEVRDRIYTLAAPFEGEGMELAALGMRYGGIDWASDDLALITEFWWKTRTLRVWRVWPGDPAREKTKVFDYSFQDRYSDPGSLVTTTNAYGRRVLRTVGSGDSVFLIGDGASPEGDRPFIDRLAVDSGEKTRLFRSEAPYFENPIDVLDEEGRVILTRRESVNEVPNYFVRPLPSGDLRQLTDLEHPTPQLTGLTKEIIQYEREDGVPLSAALYLPPGYDAERDGPLPTLMWAYPQEFKSADAAGQIDDSPYRFSRIGWWSPLIWLSRGYAVLDDPKMPIIGEDEVEPNDTFRKQLVDSAAAAVAEVVRRGVADENRIAIGGHSYGAFMTANLLAHSDLFAAGIARSGAYNRTLTPFGFQAEERTLWEAPEVYFTMSPFMHAEKVNEPILLIHGDADNNSGTFPLQSERYYSALKGHGATARLVMLPLESHGYRARESILHMLWETERWMEEYVAGAGEEPEVETPEEHKGASR